jgi:hypothetical protein
VRAALARCALIEYQPATGCDVLAEFGDDRVLSLDREVTDEEPCEDDLEAGYLARGVLNKLARSRSADIGDPLEVCIRNIWIATLIASTCDYTWSLGSLFLSYEFNVHNSRLVLDGYR